MIDTTDQDALRRAMTIAMQDPAKAEQLKSKLQHEPWHEVAAFAAYSCQVDALHLPPYEDPPALADEDDRYPQRASVNGQKVLKRLLAAGLSRYEPDPMAALKRTLVNHKMKCVNPTRMEPTTKV